MKNSPEELQTQPSYMDSRPHLSHMLPLPSRQLGLYQIILLGESFGAMLMRLVCFCAQVDDEVVDTRKLMEDRQKLLNDIERLRAENDSLKVHVASVCMHVFEFRCLWF